MLLRSVGIVVVALGLAGCLGLVAFSDWGVANTIAWHEAAVTGDEASELELPKVTQPWQRPQKLISAPLPPRPEAAAETPPWETVPRSRVA